jgi:hypothetical protein
VRQGQDDGSRDIPRVITNASEHVCLAGRTVLTDNTD